MRGLLLFVIALGLGWAGASFYAYDRDAAPAAAAQESTYARVMRTQELRCGYMLYEPMVRRDPNSGAFSGVAVDVAEELGRLLNIRIVWAEETGFGTAIEGLRTRRYDALCIGYWRLAAEGKHLYYTIPYAYSIDQIVVRADDARFDADYRTINTPGVRIISADGMEATRIARRDFPKAALTELPNMARDADLAEHVAAGKADVTFLDAAMAESYRAANPGRLKLVPLAQPIRIFQNTFALPQDERLKAMLDTAMNELIENGGMDIILDKYDPQRKLLRRVRRGME